MALQLPVSTLKQPDVRQSPPLSAVGEKHPRPAVGVQRLRTGSGSSWVFMKCSICVVAWGTGLEPLHSEARRGWGVLLRDLRGKTGVSGFYEENYFRLSQYEA